MKAVTVAEFAAEVADQADNIAAELLHHIDVMYPAMWDGVPKSARTSVRNTMVQSIKALGRRIERAEPTKAGIQNPCPSRARAERSVKGSP